MRWLVGIVEGEALGETRLVWAMRDSRIPL